MTDATPPPSNVSAVWENNDNTDFLTPGQATSGTLTITSSDTNNPLTSQNTGSVTITIQQEYWMIDPAPNVPWAYPSSAGADADQGADIKGGKSYTLNYETGGSSPFNDGSVEVGLTITPPDSAQAPQPVQILYASVNEPGSPPPSCSNPASVAVSFAYPDFPLNVYSLDNSVILTKAGDVTFANAVSGEIANTSGAAVDPGGTITFTLSLTANTESSHTPIDGTNLTVDGGLTWTYSTAENHWTATVDSFDTGESLNFMISNLSLTWDGHADDLTTSVTANVNIAGVTTDSYDTSILFLAYGPYAISVALDTSDTSAKYYTLDSSDEANGVYSVNPLSINLKQPPLLVNLINSDGQIAYPPMYGTFSWTSQDSTDGFSSAHSLDPDNPNPLYFVIPVTTSSGKVSENLTTATINLSFSPQSICADGFKQTFNDGSEMALVAAPGTMMMWSGAPADIPAGWVLCDGTNGTPNITDYFIVGRTSDTSPANPTGNATSFAFDSPGTVDVVSVGGHTHPPPSNWGTTHAEWALDHHVVRLGSSSDLNPVVASGGGHGHSISDWSGLEVVVQDSTGATAPLRPAWYALCYIMKL